MNAAGLALRGWAGSAVNAADDADGWPEAGTAVAIGGDDIRSRGERTGSAASGSGLNEKPERKGK